MRLILWIIGLAAFLGGAASSGCEGGYIREQPYYYAEGDPYFDLYVGDAEPYYFDEHRWGEQHGWVEERGGHERGGGGHEGFHGGGGGHEGGGGHAGGGRGR
jgi:hypothetical protein